MSCCCSDSGCPFTAEGTPMNCRVCPYSNGEADEE